MNQRKLYNKKWNKKNPEKVRDQKKRYYKKSQHARNTCKRWTLEEIYYLSQDRVYFDSELSKLIGRSIQAIQVKRSKELAKKNRQTKGLTKTYSINNEGKMFNHFFAVTTTSIYEIVAKGIHDGLPSIQKIAVDAPSAVSLGQELRKGTMVAIRKDIVSYIPEDDGRIPKCWCGNTSFIVALFKTEEEARNCFKNKDRKAVDIRWQTETKAVLEAIGPDHPVFYIYEEPDFRLLS